MSSISAIVGVVALGVLVQAVTAGVFTREPNRNGWINVHSGVAYLIALLALASVVVAVSMWRGRVGGRVVLSETVALLVAVVIQIGIAGRIGDFGKAGAHPGLLAIHIPLALIIFGLALHLSTYAANLRRVGR
ncbi:MAG: hypothetical protein M3137_03840 [Actinomycetota bacterium]|nr:hypothetical protein [Actinomycetota bacterium]